jgi:hypothetical protein
LVENLGEKDYQFLKEDFSYKEIISEIINLYEESLKD